MGGPPGTAARRRCEPAGMGNLLHVFYTHGPAKLNSREPAEPGAARAHVREASRPARRPPTREPAELDHTALAVRSFDAWVPLLEQLSGARATRPERVESQGVEVCFVGNVELIRPIAADNGVARFLERRGPGLHHIAYRVPDVDRAVEALAAQGYRFTSDGPMAGAGGHRIAFMHPRSTGGVLVELVERARR